MSELSQKIIEIGKEHLGFAGEKYLRRQCRIHLDKELDDIREEDLDELAKWVKNTAPLITDQETAREMKQEILALKMR